MTVTDSSPSPAPLARPSLWKQWFLLAAILLGLFAALFHESFRPGEILFVNDVTYGLLKAANRQVPSCFTGTWYWGGWVGMEGPATPLTISSLLRMVFPPEILLKLYAPFTLFFAGVCAWLFFRQLEFSPVVCLLGGIATALDMHFFSVACWGLGLWNIAAGMTFLALAALCSKSIPRFWARGLLAGLAVGMSLMEGFDIGVILSLYVGAFIIWQAFTEERGITVKSKKALGMEALTIFFAAFIAAHTMATLVRTQVQNVVWSGSNQNAQGKDDRWAPATQWSLPKVETLGVFVPGLFGYRLIDRISGPDKSSAYWGTIGRDPRILDLKSDDPTQRARGIDGLILPPQFRAQLESPDRQTRDNAINTLTQGSPSALRFAGSGEYAGVLVSLLAIFALFNSGRADGEPFARNERRAVWFWSAAALVSLLAAWGRYGFLYRWIYELPYAYAIRNPIKFMHPFHLAWLILAAYGMEALWRRSKVPSIDKIWRMMSVGLFVAIAAASVSYLMTKSHLANYLANEGFDPEQAAAIAGFSVKQAAWFAVILVVSLAAMWTVLESRQTGALWIVLGAIVIFDSSRADLPWIRYINYKTAYASNVVLDFLADHSLDGRVIGRLAPRGLGAGLTTPLGRLYSHWQENEFPERGIHSLDFAQWPRTPEMDIAYMNNFALQGNDIFHCDLWPSERLWELTDTRYIVTSTMFLPMLNAAARTPGAFEVRMPLQVAPKPGITNVQDEADLTVVEDGNGPYALIEFTNALPRAALYSHWETPANDTAALQTLLSRDFDPHRTLLVQPAVPGSRAPGDAGSVNITAYQPKAVRLEAHANGPAILMFNGRMTSDWKGWVDGQPAPLLRCNFLMRGVLLTEGGHTVEFRYEPQIVTLWLTVAAWVTGLLTGAYLVLKR